MTKPTLQPRQGAIALQTANGQHQPVLIKTVVELLAVGPSPTYLDCTFGRGGHSQALLVNYPDCQVVAIDCDPEAQAKAHQIRCDYPGRFEFHDCNFTDLDRLLKRDYHAILFDLGVSSPMLDTPGRGFSFRFSAKPDMRLDPRIGTPASIFLETASWNDLVTAIRNYGEERSWRRIVQAIIHARGSGLLQDTVALAEHIASIVPQSPGSRTRLHPATKAFQGIRMAVNGELNALEQVLPKAMDRLLPGGLLAVISFHSLEDRIVKRFFRRMAGQPEHAWDSLPQDFRQHCATILTPKPITATEDELRDNPRSRSAKLRVLRKDD